MSTRAQIKITDVDNGDIILWCNFDADPERINPIIHAGLDLFEQSDLHNSANYIAACIIHEDPTCTIIPIDPKFLHDDVSYYYEVLRNDSGDLEVRVKKLEGK